VFVFLKKIVWELVVDGSIPRSSMRSPARSRVRALGFTDLAPIAPSILIYKTAWFLTTVGIFKKKLCEICGSTVHLKRENKVIAKINIQAMV
jgi:hypothetical protein